MKFPRAAPALVLANARIHDPVTGERRSSVRIARGRIAAFDASPRRGEIVFDLQDSLVLPGFINAHDHLELNNFPRLKYRDRYDNARDWSADLNARLDSDPVIVAARQVPLPERLFHSGLKNLMAGATTVAHHNPFHAPLRRDFPVRVVTPYRWSHSLYLAPDFAQDYRRTPRHVPWMIHLSEGTDAPAQTELEQLDCAGALQANTVLIHGVGLSPHDRVRALEQNAALVWCPSSNLFMLDATAEVRDFAQAHRLALGTDSRLTGERDLLDELRVARATGQVDAEDLFRAATCDAALILRQPRLGRIAPGLPADLVILPAHIKRVTDAIGAIRRADLRAVFVNGAVRVADPDFAPLMDSHARAVLDGHSKLFAGNLAERARASRVPEPGFSLSSLN